MSTVQHKSIFNFPTNKSGIGIRIIWLFHICAIIGVTLGFFDFFIQKTILNLLVSFSLLVWVFPINSSKKILTAALCFMVGMVVEYLGVNHGLLFGEYTYGSNLGPKVLGVPWLIGINWAMLIFITGAVADRFEIPDYLKVIIGAFLMIILDFLMEASAPIFDFWEFKNQIVPMRNYVSWFVISLILHAFFRYLNIKGDYRFSANLYFCQVLFFTYFYFYYSL